MTRNGQNSENKTNSHSIMKIKMNGRRVGDITSFSCPIGYGLRGETEIFCLQSGQWSALIPYCEGILIFAFLCDSIKMINRIENQNNTIDIIYIPGMYHIIDCLINNCFLISFKD